MTERNWSPPDLRGRAAVVAGATRGAGRAIAVSPNPSAPPPSVEEDTAR